MNRITESYAVHAEMKPDQIAIIDEQESITYQDWYERVQRSAQWLQGTVHQQKRIAFLLSNGASFCKYLRALLIQDGQPFRLIRDGVMKNVSKSSC